MIKAKKMHKYHQILVIMLFINVSACVITYKAPTPKVNDLFEQPLTRQTIKLHENNNNSYFPGADSHDNVLYYLDMGMLHFHAGNIHKSNILLSQAERAIENNFTKSITQYASSFILDDRMLTYNAEEYEDIYLNVFKALNYFQQNNVDAAGVELRRVNEKLNVLQDKYDKMADQINHFSDVRKTKRKVKAERINFYNSALSRYLSSIYYQFEKQYDEARIDIQHACAAFNQQRSMYNFNKPRYLTVLYQCLTRNRPRTCFKSKKEKLHLIAFAGRTPEKIAKTYYIVSKKNCIIIARNQNGSDRMDIIPWPGIKPGYFFKFSLPHMKKRPDRVKKIVAYINKTPVRLEKLEDLAKVAIETFNVKKNMIYLKTIVRATVKGLIAANIKKNIGNKKQKKKNLFEALFFEGQKAMVDIAMSATENADLRMSSFFPAEAYSGSVSVPPGSYHVKIVYYDCYNKPIQVKNLGKHIVSKDGLNLIQSSYYDMY
jgi:hypothetical protein